MDRILVDECLSVALVGVAKGRGLYATHVVWLGREGTQDWNLVSLISEGGFAFVTNNRRDFLKLYADLDLHDGLIIIVPSVRGEEQVRLFNVALDAAEALDSTMNKLIEVDLDGLVQVREWSARRAVE
jgi:predicted nuclease of predicted toxin-antitoxin system